jgi:phosphatidylethanolamine-binding protein (PEBP) family uncharacterized protein
VGPERPQTPQSSDRLTWIADGPTTRVAPRSGIFGAGGQDVSPDLTWSGFATQTRSFVVTMYDAAALTPTGFWHWG